MLGLVIAVGGVTYVRLREDEPAAVTETAPLSVRAVAAEREPIRAWVSIAGNVRAVEYQHLTFETEGDVHLPGQPRWPPTAGGRYGRYDEQLPTGR